MSVVSFDEIYESGQKAQSEVKEFVRKLEIKGVYKDEIQVVIVKPKGSDFSSVIFPNASGFGVRCHVVGDADTMGWINVYVDQMILDGGHDTMDCIRAWATKGSEIYASMGRKPGQLKLSKVLRFEK